MNKKHIDTRSRFRQKNFYPELRYFTDHTGPTGALYENEFWKWISNTKINVSNRAKKVDSS